MINKKYDNYLIKDISKINSDNYSNKDNWNYILYLDTKNITKNSIDNIKKYSNDDKIPSRAKRIVKKNDIIISTVRPKQEHYGILRSLPNNLLVSTGFTVISPNENMVDPDYLYYYLTQKNIINFLQNIAEQSTTSYPSIKSKDIENIKIFLPSLKNQRQMAYILRKIDEKIENIKKINQNLLKISNCIYLRINEKYSNKLIQYKLSDISKIKYGKNLPIINLKNEGYPVYGGNGIIGYYGEYIYKTSQILVSCRGEASGKVLFSKPHSFITNNSLVLECERKYYYFLKEFSLLNEFYECVTGSAQPQITIKNIKNIPIKIPNDEILNKYNKVFEIIESYYFENLTEIDMLKRLRDTLLPKLIFGEIDVSEIEI